MSYRDPGPSLAAENERLRAENARLRSGRGDAPLAVRAVRASAAALAGHALVDLTGAPGAWCLACAAVSLFVVAIVRRESWP